MDLKSVGWLVGKFALWRHTTETNWRFLRQSKKREFSQKDKFLLGTGRQTDLHSQSIWERRVHISRVFDRGHVHM